MASTQPQILVFTPPSMRYKVAVPVSPVPPVRQEAQQLTMCFGAKSRAYKFQKQQTKQIERFGKRQKEMERELEKQKKAKKDESHHWFRFGNVGRVQCSPSASL